MLQAQQRRARVAPGSRSSAAQRTDGVSERGVRGMPGSPAGLRRRPGDRSGQSLTNSRDAHRQAAPQRRLLGRERMLWGQPLPFTPLSASPAPPVATELAGESRGLLRVPAERGSELWG